MVPPVDTPALPAGFRFGASTASYQIEGAAQTDGRGPSIWDTFAHTPGKILNGDTGDTACDHYHRYAEDVALMARLGLDGYRLSVSWSRVLPEGRGRVNQAGLDFYDRLADELLANGVRPMVTLHHWDLPQALEDQGGWLNRDTVAWFSEFAAVLGERLSDRVEHWVPVNEPSVLTNLGYALGLHAPGRTLMFDAFPVAHHLLLGHAGAVEALRRTGATSIGTAMNHAPVWPASEEESDRTAAAIFDEVWNLTFSDSVLLGRYPELIADLLTGWIQDGDLARISAQIDFYGVNYYNPMCVGAPPAGSALPFEHREIPGYPTTDFGWPVVPDGLHELLVGLNQRYPGRLPPVFITESGCSYAMGPDAAGVVDDQSRIDYLDAHLRAIARAVADGVDVRGYYTWSLLDNFEWAEGYSQRFGLVYVDFDTLTRIPKRSFDWYAAVIAEHRERAGRG